MGNSDLLVFAPPRVPLLAHGLLAAWVLFFLVMAEAAPLRYDVLLQEDRFVEWLTVLLFGAAAWFAGRRALRQRNPFDALVGAFCVFVAGEEFSWGQRLLGLTPPDAFLEHNRQQELTIHNFANLFGEPKWILILALVGFGLVLPLVAQTRAGKRLLDRIGASTPTRSLVPWFIAAVVLLVWYPHSFTGEWVEAVAGGLFMLTFMPGVRAAGIAMASCALAALMLALLSGRTREPTQAELACATAELEALVDDIARGTAATGRLIGANSVHKRVFTAIEEGYVRGDRLTALEAVSCPADGDAPDRRRHVIDPWGTAYWLRLDRADRTLEFEAYSFGPNRRRDPDGGDDLIVHLDVAPLSRTPSPSPGSVPGEVTSERAHPSSSVEPNPDGE